MRKFNGGLKGKLADRTPSAASGVWDTISHQVERGASNWLDLNPGLYAFTSYTFSPAGASTSSSRRFGPTLAQCQSAYTGAAFIDSYFAVPVQGVQRLVVPKTGAYRVTAAGARGGTRTSYSGGSGRIIVADVNLVAGDYVYILVGHQGGAYTSDGQCGGGGGGTFFSTGASWDTSTLLVAAGGGGGHDGGQGGIVASQHGQAGTSGGGWGGGTNGSGGTSGSGSEEGASGGGWLSAGSSSCYYPGAQIRSSTSAAGAQSVYGDSANVGGFGGGASGWGAAGGGGGYSGGGAQSSTTNTGNRVSGGGGGSYYSGTLVSDTGLNTGDGYLTLTKL